MNAKFFLLNAFAQEDFLQKLENTVRPLNISVRICPAIVVDGKSDNQCVGAFVTVDGMLPEVMRAVAVLKAQSGAQQVFVSAMREECALHPGSRFP